MAVVYGRAKPKKIHILPGLCIKGAEVKPDNVLANLPCAQGLCPEYECCPKCQCGCEVVAKTIRSDEDGYCHRCKINLYRNGDGIGYSLTG